MTSRNGSSVIRTKNSKSGTTKYGDPVILKDTSRTKVTVVPFFITRSEGSDFACKIETFNKSKNDFLESKDKTVSLSEQESRNLLVFLKSHLAIADEKEVSGDYIVIKVGADNGDTDLSDHNPAAVANALAGVLGQKDILEHIKDTEFTAELCEALRGAIRMREISTAIEHLRKMLNNGTVLERYYQKWCDDHYWAFGMGKHISDLYRRISISDEVDKLIPSISTGLSDLIELKRPDMSVLKYDEGHKNYYFSKDTSSAIGQCHRYLDVLNEEASQGLRDHPEIVAYHPRATIVIGRSNDWNDEKIRALHGLNQRLHGIKIMTYDHLLAQCEVMLKVFENDRVEDELFDEEIPF